MMYAKKGAGVGIHRVVFFVAAGLVACVGTASADIASDKPAAVLVFPKLVVDSETGLDTLVRLSNTSNDEQKVLCFYVNVTPQCSRPGFACFPGPDDCQRNGGFCTETWQETDFELQLTARQPTSWLVSSGQDLCRPQFDRGFCSDNPGKSCARNADCSDRCVFPSCLPLSDETRQGPHQQVNEGKVPLSPQEPFLGELKCVAVDATGMPIAKNVLTGQALVGRHGGGGRTAVDLTGYVAVGIPAIEGRGNRDNTLVIGGPNAEYQGCPNILIFDHYFDGAVDPIASNRCVQGSCLVSQTPCANDDACDDVRVGTDLALVPCTQDFRTQNPQLSSTVAQFLVFNEFEQRFSTSRTVTGFRESRLSNLDTPQSERSIFSVGVEGTLTGQTRVRGVVDGGADHGNTLVGLISEFRCLGPDFPECGFTETDNLVSSAILNLHFQGIRPQADFWYLP